MSAAGYYENNNHQDRGGVHGSTRLGGGAFNHKSSAGAEQEYDRLRDLARQEHDRMSSCFDRAHQAYGAGDGAEAHSLSEEGKKHQRQRDQYNKQASEYIFRENNATERVASDTIDLHGQYVAEAEQILEQRIRMAKSQGQNHLHVIVGKGNHSPGHIQKIKPMVERICREEGLQFSTEENAGRIFVNLQGGPANMPPSSTWGDSYNQGSHSGGGYQSHQQPQYAPGGGQPGKPQQQFDQEQQQQQQQQQNDDPIMMCLKIFKSCFK